MPCISAPDGPLPTVLSPLPCPTGLPYYPPRLPCHAALPSCCGCPPPIALPLLPRPLLPSSKMYAEYAAPTTAMLKGNRVQEGDHHDWCSDWSDDWLVLRSLASTPPYGLVGH